jgi:cyclopropane-fatty-acyl-phospholipid synthase
MQGETIWSAESPDPVTQKSCDFLKKLFADVAEPFSVRFWNGTEWRHGNAPPRFTLDLKHPAAPRLMFWRANEVRLGEAYLRDDFDVKGDLEASFSLADNLFERSWRLTDKLRLACTLLRLPRSRGGSCAGGASLCGKLHSKERDATAVRYHYDVSNDFYRLWLDPEMVYSCAVFHHRDESLADAQQRKLDYICRKLRLKPGQRLLDIGCGWGGLIMHAAESYDVEATGITLSERQAELARQRIRERGLSGRCRVEVRDYRDLDKTERFDKLVSVGMFEHVGEAKLPDYFARAYALLKPGGVFLNHGITENINRQDKDGPSFIDKYVFPDGELVPVTTALRAAEQVGFEVHDVEGLREHYAMTLRHWVRRLEEQRERALALTNEETYRVWRIYMAGSAYGFANGKLGLYQALLVKPDAGANPLPLTRCDWYRPCPSGLH